MKTFSKIAVLAAFVATTSFAMVPTNASAATNCDAHGAGSNVFTHSTDNSAYKINGNQTTVTFDVSGCSNGIDVSVISWKASNPTDGKPFNKQVMFAHKTDHFSNGRHSMTIALPDCYFQIDTVTGTKLTGETDSAHKYGTRQIAFMHGGSKSCEEKKKTTNTTTHVTPTPQATTPTPTATVQAKELPHTGPAAAISTFFGASGAGTLVHRYISRKARRP